LKKQYYNFYKRVQLFTGCIQFILKLTIMKYYFSKVISEEFNDVVDKVTEALKAEGFGILTEIDVQATLKEKLDVDFRHYKILGACNPPFAFKALQAEEYIGTMLPCNVIVQSKADGNVEVSAIDPVASMQAVENESLLEVAQEIRSRLKSVIEHL